MLKIDNLTIKKETKIILSGFSLSVPKGQTILLSGSNGTGKSTLTQVIMGNKDYITNEDSILKWNDIDLINLESDEISRLGVFVSFQHPVEVPGVPLLSFLKLISDQNRLAKNLSKYSAKEFMSITKTNLDLLNWPQSVLKRNLNEGMSGGEKKKSELLQMLTLDPDLIILDEIDSGMDSETKLILLNLIKILQQGNKTILIISHNQEQFGSIKIDQKIQLQ